MMFVTLAFVPAGLFCQRCQTMLMQYLPPDGPDVLGYVSADWAWMHKHGKEWTTQHFAGLLQNGESGQPPHP
jgi:hypothetical protein